MKGAAKSRKIDFPDSPSRMIYAFLRRMLNDQIVVSNLAKLSIFCI